eukprot:7468175-Pyramimonas_sp.AAC.1
MHRRCIADVGAASATSAWRKSGSASSRMGIASAMRRDPPTTSELLRPHLGGLGIPRALRVRPRASSDA